MSENKPYSVELREGSINASGNFIARDVFDNIYFAHKSVLAQYKEIFDELAEDHTKWAVINDEQGTGKWKGSIFRKIQFITSNRDSCIQYAVKLILKEELRYNEMDLFTEKLEALRSGVSSKKVYELNLKLADIKTRKKKIDEDLQKLIAKNK